MIEKLVIDYLESVLTNVNVYAEEPATEETEFVVVERVGSSLVNHIESAEIAVQSYSSSLLGAATLNDTVKKKMLAMIGQTSVSAVRLNSDYNFTDTDTKRYRYQAVYTITLL